MGKLSHCTYMARLHLVKMDCSIAGRFQLDFAINRHKFRCSIIVSNVTMLQCIGMGQFGLPQDGPFPPGGPFLSDGPFSPDGPFPLDGPSPPDDPFPKVVRFH
jgi:hypothetical protein